MAFTVLINKNAGSVTKHGHESLSEGLKNALGDKLEKLMFLDGSDLQNALENFPSEKNILIGGGDGTIRSAASTLKKRNIPFGILPLGTMNLFAKDLSLELDIFQLAKMYNKFKFIKIDAANVNGELFLCNAMVGITSQIAKEREEHRNNETFLKWFGLVQKGFQKLSSSQGRLMFMTHHGITEKKSIKAAVIANNEYEDAGGIGTFKKKSLNDGKLSVYTINPEGTVESILLLSKLALGSWKEAKGMDFFDTANLKVETRRRKTDVLLDGEIHTFFNPLIFKTEPESLTIIVPES